MPLLPALTTVLLNATSRRGLQTMEDYMACINSLPDPTAFQQLQQAGDEAGLQTLMCSTSECREMMALGMDAGDQPAGTSPAEMVQCMCDVPAMHRPENGTVLAMMAATCDSSACRSVLLATADLGDMNTQDVLDCICLSNQTRLSASCDEHDASGADCTQGVRDAAVAQMCALPTCAPIVEWMGCTPVSGATPRHYQMPG
jgi:hypothetical protein